MAGVYVYHAKRQNFVGNQLYPLNVLKDKLPDIYNIAVKKYQGREWLLDVAIPGLDALWNDVIHFSLMHPELIYKTLSEVGFKHHKNSLTWVEVPLADVMALPSTLYLNVRPWQESKVLLPSDFEAVKPERVLELSGMPEINLQYYRNCLRNNEMPLFWKRAPHLLVKGELDISRYRTFDWHKPEEKTIQSVAVRGIKKEKGFDSDFLFAIVGTVGILPLLGGLTGWRPPNEPLGCVASRTLEFAIAFPLLLPLLIMENTVVFLGTVSALGFILVKLREYINWIIFYSVLGLLYFIILVSSLMVEGKCSSIFSGM